MGEETEQLHATIAAQERELVILRQAYVIVTGQHRAALTSLQLRVSNATGAIRRAATAAAKAATTAEDAASVASEVVAKATRDAAAQAEAQVAIVRAAVTSARAEVAEAAEAELAAAEIAEAAVASLDADLGSVRHLEGLLSICMSCKKIRSESKAWHQLEKYISEHSDAIFSHGVCPECLEKEMKKWGKAPIPLTTADG